MHNISMTCEYISNFNVQNNSALVCFAKNGRILSKLPSIIDIKYLEELIIVRKKNEVNNKRQNISNYTYNKSTINNENPILDIIVVDIVDLQLNDLSCLRKLAIKIEHAIHCCKLKSFTLCIESVLSVKQICEIMYTLFLRSYHSNIYTSKRNINIVNCQIFTESSILQEVEDMFNTVFFPKIQGVVLARDLVNEPPNILTPKTYVERIKQAFQDTEVQVKVLSLTELKELEMNALLGVAQGGYNEPYVVVLEYNVTDTISPVILAGKGVCFDSGGISLKPSFNMHKMKYDMGGSATVVGTMKTLSLRRSNASVVGIVGLVENMPGNNAQRPGDIVTSRSGKTIEILNTDAEGRLVLADLITYVQDFYDPKIIIDFATLTGAITVALGSVYAGVFSNDKMLINHIQQSANDTDELVWHMPLNKEFNNYMNSTIADMANISNTPGAGASTAAHFIQRFVDPKIKWMHLDIAGVAWADKGNALVKKDGTGFGVNLIDNLIKNHYE